MDGSITVKTKSVVLKNRPDEKLEKIAEEDPLMEFQKDNNNQRDRTTTTIA